MLGLDLITREQFPEARYLRDFFVYTFNDPFREKLRTAYKVLVPTIRWSNNSKGSGEIFKDNQS